ncbi:MAG: DUF3795 domain-containing protein [Desulfatiglans sp.]|jgi:hypothetical protein|nr:DUF3795 domain-containing protein [Desulfatiglans sp.]
MNTLIKNITRRDFVIGAAATAVGCACLKLDCLTAHAMESKQDAEQKNEILVAPCGLYCGACPMYIATQSKDKGKLDALVKQFSTGPMKLEKEDILCDGCIGNGRVASFCRDCAMRKCALDKEGVTRCSDCKDEPCEKVTKFNNDGMPHHGEVLSNLSQIKKMGIEKWAKHEKERWSCPKCGLQMAWYDSKCSGCGAPRSDKLFTLRPFPKQP